MITVDQILAWIDAVKIEAVAFRDGLEKPSSVEAIVATMKYLIDCTSAEVTMGLCDEFKARILGDQI